MLKKKFGRITLLTCALVLMSFAASYAHTQVSYTFKVHNKSKNKIVKLLASEDGKAYAKFDIGDGIAGGETATLEWDKSTDNGNCEWHFKAVFDDAEESEPATFDFCEKNLVLEFN
ncbi:MAG: hypothetical protein JWM21_2093 [Acidobacteria bacterium]|nr:hypothetical protein [Acidobacteriota bacterium]